MEVATQVFRPSLETGGYPIWNWVGALPPSIQAALGLRSIQEPVGGGGDCLWGSLGCRRSVGGTRGKEGQGLWRVPAGKEPVKVSAVSFFIYRNNSPFELLG